MIWHDTHKPGSPALQASDLKICDLCGALNLASNAECYTCRWHGSFERRPEVVTLAMELVERKQGHLEPLMLSDSLGPYTAKSGLRDRLGAFFAKALRRMGRRRI